MTVRTLIVDDMKLARERLRQALAVDPDFEIVRECGNGREAVAAIQTLSLDLVFLDVQMPEMGGFDVVETIGVEKFPAVIFVTAFDEFAIRAFEVHAVDYLLKPIDDERLSRTLHRFKRMADAPDAEQIQERVVELLATIKVKNNYLKRIPVKVGQHTVLLLTDDIDWIGAAGNYLEIYAGRETYLIRERLSQIELKLDPEKFARIHRSTIVNIDRIHTMHPMFNGDQVIVLRNGKKLNLSRTYYENLLNYMSR